jgi:hypothetical protein
VLVALRTAIATQEWRLLATDYRTHYAQREAEAGARPPNYAWLDQHGRRVSLGGLRGQVILLAFWEPGDRELEATLKRLKEWWREFHREGLAVIGVGLSDDLDVASQVAQAQNVPFPMVVDLENVVVPDRDPDMDSEAPSFDPDDPTMGPSPGGPRQRGEAVSPTATAFGVGHGSALLLDREGRLCEEKLSLDEKAAKQTRQTIKKYVRGEG